MRKFKDNETRPKEKKPPPDGVFRQRVKLTRISAISRWERRRGAGAIKCVCAKRLRDGTLLPLESWSFPSSHCSRWRGHGRRNVAFGKAQRGALALRSTRALLEGPARGSRVCKRAEGWVASFTIGPGSCAFGEGVICRLELPRRILSPGHKKLCLLARWLSKPPLAFLVSGQLLRWPPVGNP